MPEKKEVLVPIGTNLSPTIKVDFALGEYVRPYKLSIGYLMELVSLGLITTDTATYIGKWVYWYYVRLQAPNKIYNIAREEPSIIIGALTHLKHIIKRDDGVWEDELKCKKINDVRDDPKAREKVCEECGLMEMGECNLGMEYDEEASFVDMEIELNFEGIDVDEKWVEDLEKSWDKAFEQFEDAIWNHNLTYYTDYRDSIKNQYDSMEDTIKAQLIEIANTLEKMRTGEIVPKVRTRRVGLRPWKFELMKVSYNLMLKTFNRQIGGQKDER